MVDQEGNYRFQAVLFGQPLSKLANKRSASGADLDPLSHEQGVKPLIGLLKLRFWSDGIALFKADSSSFPSTSSNAVVKPDNCQHRVRAQ
jgi:hypothetical protein